MPTQYAGTYETTLTVPVFRGIHQQQGDTNVNAEYAAYAENCQTRGGALAPARAPREAFAVMAGDALPTGAAIGTLACFHRRYGAEAEAADVLIAAVQGRLYMRLGNALGWRQIAEGYLCDDWDFVTYELNTLDAPQEGAGTPQEADAPIDVLLMSNPVDGMICVRGDTFEVVPVPTPKKFGVICRHAERIWGSGIADDPDMLVYSAPYDPFDWAQNDEFPEDGAGDILQPSWDGDRFIALRNYGEYLLAFKRDTVWRVLGTDPGQYVMRQQYGEDGAVAENTIVTERSLVFMLYAQGVSVYDGNGVQPLHRDALRDVFARVNREAIACATAVCWQHRYMLALPLDGCAHNNAVVVYDTVANTWMLRIGLAVAAFCRYGERLLFTSADEPGRVLAMDEGPAHPMRWEMPYQDQRGKNAVKSGFTIYLTPEADTQAAITLTVQTESRTKSKQLIVPAGDRRTRRVRIGARGRRWRLVIASEGGPVWKLVGGIQVDMEVDAD